jgi:integrase
MAIARLARAWDVVQRLHPRDVPKDNPFRGCVCDHAGGTTRPATRDEASALHAALVAAGEPHLAAVPLIAFEWHQRPENVIAGAFTWADWRPAHRPDAVRIAHAKTGVEVWQPLSDEEGAPLFPELTAYLDGLERLGVPAVLMRPQRRNRDSQTGRLTRPPAKPFSLREARKRVRNAAAAAGLPDWLTLAACRHGGMTELGDAGATEQEVMASSGHKTPDAARLYVKRTEKQRLSAAKKRKALRST